MTEREITVGELMTAKDYLERGIAILNKCGCVIAEDVQRALAALLKLKVNEHSGSPEDCGDDVGFESAEDVSDWVNQHYKTIRAALAQKVGE